MKTSRHQDESGIALILTLTILAVVLILLMSFIVSMRTERTAAKASSDLSRAKALAEAGVEEAIGLLQASMTNITATTSYITAPGVVYTRIGATWTPVPLFISGAAAVDLNTTNNSITGISPTYPLGSTPLRVNWLNVPLPNVGPLAGRFTYWVDDESAKVDINTAQSPRTDLAGFTPAAIDLGQIFSPTDAGNITTYVATRPLDSIESIKLGTPPGPAGPSVSSTTFSNNQFSVTTSATSPDLTPWGTKRINLNTLLPITATKAQKQAAVTTIANVLSDPTGTNLKAWFGSTFADKYSQPNQIQQIAANIVDYITKDNIPTDSSSFGDMTAPQYLGLKQTPYLNELVISNSFVLTLNTITPSSSTITLSTTITAELWYMYTNSTGWIPPAGTTIVVQGLPNISLAGWASQTITPGGGTISTGFLHMLPNPGTTTAGTYLTVQTALAPVSFSADATVATTAKLFPTTATPITAVFGSPSSLAGRMDYAQIKMPLGNIIGQISQANPNLTLVWQAQCNDPRVKPISNTWQQGANGAANTLGFANSSLVVNMSTGNGTTIPGDGDISCHIVSGSRGAMYPSELAYIHTGIPWRTFFLEPQPTTESGMVPDWLAVDLFSGTDATNVAGRMNINVRMDDGNSLFPVRTQPLGALLSGNTSVTTVTDSIYKVSLHNTPPAGSLFASAASGAPDSFTTAGQVCEVNGLADATGVSKSQREFPAQQIVNLITPRSDTFTIWAMGQSIKKVNLAVKSFDPLHGDLITGEVKIEAVVQRYEDPSTTPARVRFRTLYYRYIYE